MKDLHLRYKRETGNRPGPYELSVYLDEEELPGEMIISDFGTDINILSELESSNRIEIPNQEYIDWLERQLQ